jgi:hypothetical protein
VSDAALRAQVDDPSVYLDFWSPHWYAWMNPYWSQPMYGTPAAFDLDDSKPAVIGENPANGTEGHTLFEDLEAAYLNGWSGLLPWTSNEVDSNGGWEEVSAAASAFIADSERAAAVFPDADADDEPGDSNGDEPGDSNNDGTNESSGSAGCFLTTIAHSIYR